MKFVIPTLAPSAGNHNARTMIPKCIVSKDK
jgi:hypothetical protein